ncbi:transcriptional regulator [Pilimelia anulata]|uniref:Transcriptional regulator n=1 Tax=Pilimelia anulata TaxID=53371 RepID=A0A8J3AZD9_9ACTN|nr:XRE family transcriptional regulator [Pilimelia anulata]GGJ74144.1 transcriptional regulator [Pilimelia anulata]
MRRARLDPAALAAAVGVDVKTVRRWLVGRLPRQRTRHAVADLLRESEAQLWPQTRPDLAPGAEATAEVVAAYAHRADVPRQLWTSLLVGAAERIDLLGYAYPFVLELLPDTVARLAEKAAGGARIRLALADPDCAHVRERDELEGIGGTLAGRIRNALNFLEPLAGLPGVAIGLHSVHLYNSVFRFDQQMIVTPHLYRLRGYQHPALHLRELSPYGIFGAYAAQVEAVWRGVAPGGGDGRAA